MKRILIIMTLMTLSVGNVFADLSLTQKALTDDEQRTFLTWTDSTLIRLEGLEGQTTHLPRRFKVNSYLSAFDDILHADKQKYIEHVVRTALERTIELSRIIDEELNPESVSGKQLKFALVKTFNDFALDILKHELNGEKAGHERKVSHNDFTWLYYDLLRQFVQSIVDQSLEYKFRWHMLVYLHKDIARTPSNASEFAVLVSQIYEMERDIPREFPQDSREGIFHLKRMRAMDISNYYSNVKAENSWLFRFKDKDASFIPFQGKHSPFRFSQVEKNGDNFILFDPFSSKTLLNFDDNSSPAAICNKLGLRFVSSEGVGVSNDSNLMFYSASDDRFTEMELVTFPSMERIRKLTCRKESRY